MDTFVSRKRRRVSPSEMVETPRKTGDVQDEDSTDLKLALLASLHPNVDSSTLLEALLVSEGSVEAATAFLVDGRDQSSPRKKSNGIGYQSSLTSFNVRSGLDSGPSKKRQLTKKGQTLHLYSPEDIAVHTPCSIIHNFLPQKEADALLLELLEEVPTYQRERFQLFERVVESPHTMAFYVDTEEDAERQKTDYIYNGMRTEVRQSLPQMRKVSSMVQRAVNAEIKTRIQDFYPEGKKLQYQSPDEWKPNTAFVNCYDGGAESVGYHTDQLTYLGPRAIIGSLSLGVAREFRVRKISAKEDDVETDSSRKNDKDNNHADAQEMQEEWKHSIAPAQAIDTHPIAKNKRLNITYRFYKKSLHPRYTPKCKCNVPTVLRCVQRKKGNRGRYMWMCHTNYTPGKKGCSFFQWAEFDDDGKPPWAKDLQMNAPQGVPRPHM